MKNYPEIIFKYSSVYDRRYKREWQNQNKKGKDYPSQKSILNYIKKIEKLWKKEEKKVLKEISKVSHLKWSQKSFECFVVGRCRPFAYPLTLPIYEGKSDYFIDVLTHELIHQLFIPETNKKKLKKAWSYFNRKYKAESRETRIHILVYAIHSHIYMKFYGIKRLKKNIERIGFRKDYKRAWDIVQKEGADNIIQEFTEKIK
jgi:hypothetical protein